MTSLPDGMDLLPRTPGIYLILNRCTGRIYVGQSTSVRARCTQHRSELKAGTHTNHRMRLDAARHGSESFCFVPVSAASEAMAIAALGAADSTQGYNRTDGTRWTAETSLRRLETRLARRGRYEFLPWVDQDLPLHAGLVGSWLRAWPQTYRPRSAPQPPG